MVDHGYDEELHILRARIQKLKEMKDLHLSTANLQTNDYARGLATGYLIAERILAGEKAEVYLPAEIERMTKLYALDRAIACIQKMANEAHRERVSAGDRRDWEETNRAEDEELTLNKAVVALKGLVKTL